MTSRRSGRSRAEACRGVAIGDRSGDRRSELLESSDGLRLQSMARLDFLRAKENVYEIDFAYSSPGSSRCWELVR